MESGGGKIAISAQAIHCRDDVIESGECPVNLTKPYVGMLLNSNRQVLFFNLVADALI
jgi:hypothetical protein